MNAAIKPSNPYRPDIDGLRALAVLAVLFFHAGIGCRGGFVGVDIFFVISGFLISSLIIQELTAGTFSLVHFWERRIRRIMPAWAVVAMVSLVAGWFLFMPPDFTALGQSAIAQATLLSNVFFWQETKAGYFAASPDTMPLLHTWSLAVEEQFYVLFPLLLLIPMRWRRITFLEIIICLWVGSFIISVFGTPAFPTMGFYLLPMRAWELLSGALLAAGYRNLPVNRFFRETCGWVGLALMLYAIVFYNRYTPFPGWGALLPCLGAVLFIASGKGDTSLVGRIFFFKPVVFIGLISYSLYLWHWPVLVFAKDLAKEPPGLLLRLGLLAASFGLAIISWQWIETPVRRARILKSRRQLFGLAGGCLLAFVLTGLLIDLRHGWPERLTPAAWKYLNVAKNIPFRNEITLDGKDPHWADYLVELGSQPTNQPVFVLICGDSHAMAVTPVIDGLCRKYSQRGKLVALSTTPPIIGFFHDEGFQPFKKVPSQADLIVTYVAQHHVKNVILTARWHEYSDAKEFKPNLALTVSQLVAAGAHVYLLKDVPAPNFNVSRLAAVVAMNHRDVDDLTFSTARYAAEDLDLQPAFDLAGQSGAIILDPSPYFVAANHRFNVAKNGELLFWDDNHMAVAGAMALQPLLEPIFKND